MQTTGGGSLDCCRERGLLLNRLMKRLLDHFQITVKYVALKLAKAGAQGRVRCIKAATAVKQFEIKTHLSFVVITCINISPSTRKPRLSCGRRRPFEVAPGSILCALTKSPQQIPQTHAVGLLHAHVTKNIEKKKSSDRTANIFSLQMNNVGIDRGVPSADDL